jgi:hypothetical protein
MIQDHSKKHHISAKKPDKEKLKDPSKDLKFGLFKRCKLQRSRCTVTLMFPLAVHYTSSQEFRKDNAVVDSSLDNLPASVQRVLSTIETLKSQHASLLTSIQALAESGYSRGPSPLPVTTEEDEHLDNQQVPASSIAIPAFKGSRHTSIATNLSDSTHEWFDALDGPEEFLMDRQTMAEREGNEQPSYITVNGSRSSLVDEEVNCVDTDSDGHTQDIYPSPARALIQVTPRTKLPAPPTWDEGSMFTILKNNVGKVCLPMTCLLKLTDRQYFFRTCLR